MNNDAYFKAAVTLGDASNGCSDLTASVASISVTGAAVFNGAVTLGDASTDSFSVNGETIVNDGLTVTGLAEFDGSVVLGDQAADTIIVAGVIGVTGGACNPLGKGVLDHEVRHPLQERSRG